jgi:Tfp pilus assembly protein PilE
MLTRVENSNSLPEKFSQAQATLVQHARQLERTLATQRTKLLALADSIQEQGVANKIREILG